MEFTLVNITLTFLAGIGSVLSPCVLPVLPIIFTGGERDSRLRPIFIMVGLSFTFVLMGILSSVAGSFVAEYMPYIEKISGLIIVCFGILLLFNFNPFKSISFFNRIAGARIKQGRFEGLLLGGSLGLIWIPCVGPILSSVLASVATVGQVEVGIILLLVYSAGFAVPMLIAAYSAHFFRSRLVFLQSKPLVLRLINGGILVAFGLYILFVGMLGMIA